MSLPNFVMIDGVGSSGRFHDHLKHINFFKVKKQILFLCKYVSNAD
jgi:hypothetical protein